MRFTWQSDFASGKSRRRPRSRVALVGEVAEIGKRARAGAAEHFRQLLRMLRTRSRDSPR